MDTTLIRVVDTETTGLDPIKHEIIDISILDWEGRSLFTTKIRPVRMDTADEEALRINGYNESKWKNAPTFEQVADKIFSSLDQSVMLGHNVAFDRRFVDEAFRKAGKKPPRMPHRMIDTSTLIYEHLGWESFSLVKVAQFLDVDEKMPHTAYADATMTLAVAKKLLRAGVLKRWWWKLRSH